MPYSSVAQFEPCVYMCLLFLRKEMWEKEVWEKVGRGKVSLEVSLIDMSRLEEKTR